MAATLVLSDDAASVLVFDRSDLALLLGDPALRRHGRWVWRIDDPAIARRVVEVMADHVALARDVECPTTARAIMRELNSARSAFRRAGIDC